MRLRYSRADDYLEHRMPVRFGASLRHIRERLNSALQLLEHQSLEDLGSFDGKSTGLFNDYSYPLLVSLRGCLMIIVIHS
jgi:hypothetical protein